MFLARESHITELIMYRGLINRYVDGHKSPKTKQILDSVIISTHELLLDNIKGYEVDHSIYGVVIPLHEFIRQNKYSRDYFTQVDINKILEEDYMTLKGIFSSLVNSNDLCE